MKKSYVIFIVFIVMMSAMLVGCFGSSDRSGSSKVIATTAAVGVLSNSDVPVGTVTQKIYNASLPYSTLSIYPNSCVRFDFQYDILPADCNGTNFVVTDNLGYVFPTKLVLSGRSVTVRPVTGTLFKQGVRYKLTVKNSIRKLTGEYFFTDDQIVPFVPKTVTPPKNYPGSGVVSNDLGTSVTVTMGIVTDVNDPALKGGQGRMSLVLLPGGYPAPTSVQVKSGMDASGSRNSVLMRYSVWTFGNRLDSIQITGLQPGNSYVAYFVNEDCMGTWQEIPTKVEIRTAPAPIPTPVEPPTSVTTDHAIGDLDDHFDYNDSTYSGQTGVLDNSDNVVADDPNIEIDIQHKSIKADGFFTLKGNIKYTDCNKWALVTVSKGTLSTSYWVSGIFRKRIWMPFGAGEYTVTICKVKNLNLTDEDNLDSYEYFSPSRSFKVFNTRNEDGMFYYPSDPVQSDDDLICITAKSLVKDCASDLDKIRAIHNYVVSKVYFEDEQLTKGKKGKQDAVSVNLKGVAVCEGYTSLFSALCRSIGFKTQCVGGVANNNGKFANHAWAQAWVNNKWYLIDPTWDDNPVELNYSYFLLNELDGYQGDHIKQDARVSRGSDTLPSWKGYPKGIY